MVAGYPILELHSWHHLSACCLQNVKRALTGPNRGCPGRGQQPQQGHPPPAIITTTTILDMEQIVTPTGTQNSDQLRSCTTALAPRDARLSRWLPNLGFGPMFVPSFSHLHAPPRSPHAGPPGLVSRPQRPSRRCCVRTCVVALVQHTVVPTAPERTICRHPADCGVVFVGELVSLLLAAARTRLCCLERGTHGGNGGVTLAPSCCLPVCGYGAWASRSFAPGLLSVPGRRRLSSAWSTIWLKRTPSPPPARPFSHLRHGHWPGMASRWI